MPAARQLPAAPPRLPAREVGRLQVAEESAEDETFSLKWRLIGDSYGHETRTRTIRQNWYLERFGFEKRKDLLGFLKRKQLVLDAGTGSGVDTAMFAESGVTVVAIDLSQEAALSTYRHLGHLRNVHEA